MIVFLFRALLGVIFLTDADGIATNLRVISVTNAELKNVSNLLWEADVNRAEGSDVVFNLQGHVPKGSREDFAPEKLFSKVNEDLFKNNTYQRLINLFDNYDPDIRIAEDSNKEEDAEIERFLDEIFKQRVLRLLIDFLKEKGHPFATNDETFRSAFRYLWFGAYSRSPKMRAVGIKDTSAFEHVFVGEINKGKVSGMHNWVRYYLLEKNSTEKLNYIGEIDSLQNHVVTISYVWKGTKRKSVGGFFVGTSPEYEMALYTMCFLVKRGRSCNVEVNGCPVQLIAHAWEQEGQVYIQQIYPKILKHSGKCGKHNDSK